MGKESASLARRITDSGTEKVQDDHGLLYLPLPHTRLMLPLEVGFWEIDELGETQLGGPARTDKHARLPGVGFLPQHTVMSKGRT